MNNSGDEDKDRMHGSMSSVAIHNSLVIAPDSAGLVHCLDAGTGEKYWTHDTLASVWASPLVADGKVYVGTEDGDVVILKLAKKKNLLATRCFNRSIECGPVYANGVLYIMTGSEIFAVQHH